MRSLAILFAGWEYILPAVVAASFLASYLLRSRYAGLAAWSVVAVWLTLFGYIYVETQMSRYLADEMVAWAIKSTLFLLILGLPLVPVAWYHFGRYGRRWSALASAALGALAGMAFLPIVHVVSDELAHLFAHWVPVG